MACVLREKSLAHGAALFLQFDHLAVGVGAQLVSDDALDGGVVEGIQAAVEVQGQPLACSEQEILGIFGELVHREDLDTATLQRQEVLGGPAASRVGAGVNTDSL